MRRQLIERVRERAGLRCEYCRFPERYSGLNFQIDHIIPEKHGGLTVSGNLALSCIYCNSYKGADLSGLDPATGRMVRLFHPRRDRWADHFRWQGAVLAGRTPIGRATIAVLRINDAAAMALRRLFMSAGAVPRP
ncbi:MAG: HNH endonuclease [Verrucomicrobia bacterium]|nr:HNH endonuclease [Verrucomicrobiota bacterium]